MSSVHARALSPDALHADPRDAFLPCAPPRGFRNLGWGGEAPEALRWAGCGGRARTERMLEALADALPAPRMDAALAGLARFVEIDMTCAPDHPGYPPIATPWTPPHRRRLMLDVLYGDGPEREPERYHDDPGPLSGLRLRSRVFALLGAGADPLGQVEESGRNHGAAEAAAAAFRALHDLALARLAAVADRGARFAAARRVTLAVYREIVMQDLGRATLRPDVLDACAAEPHADSGADDAASELSHVALPLWTAAAEGVAVPDDPSRLAASPEGLARALRFGVEGGVLGVEALAAQTAPRLRALPGGARWLAVDGAARARALAEWAAGGPLADRARLRVDPPPLAFLALESAAPAALGGGEGERLGALGSAIVAEALHASRLVGSLRVESAPGLRDELAAVFPFGPPPRTFAGLLAVLRFGA